MTKLFNIKDRDGHYIFEIFGKLRLSFRHKTNCIYRPTNKYGLTKEKRTPMLIISLTSFPKRINTVHLTINTLLSQTLMPDKIILWLADKEFPNKEKDLPDKLLQLKKLGLEIKWCEGLTSFKKLIPALKEFPTDIIVTADDDLYYESDWLEKLYRAYLKNKNCVYVHRIARLKIKNGKILQCNRNEIKEKCHTKPSYFNSIFGGSGCLYPPHSTHQEIFNIKKAVELADMADDLWFWAMLVLNKTKIVEISGDKSNFKMIEGTYENSLCKQNKTRDFNAIYQKLGITYPNILNHMKEELNEQ